MDFPGGSDGKVSVCLQCGRPGFGPWVGKIPWRRKEQPTPVLSPRKSHGWRSLVQATVHGITKSQAWLSDFPLTSLITQTVKNLPAVQETQVQSLDWEDPMEKGMAALPLLLPGKAHGQRRLVSYSQWGCKELDTTGWLTLSHILGNT